MPLGNYLNLTVDGTSAHAAMGATCEPELWIVYLWVRVISFMQVQYRRLVRCQAEGSVVVVLDLR